jgi:hypothetical protein
VTFRRITRWAAVVIGSAVVVAAATAAATPVSPGPAAHVGTSHPTFTWTVPAGETSNAIFIANSPERDAAGFFLDPNVVELSYLTGETRWTSRGLYAGRYWWMVGSNDNASHHFWSPVSDLEILPSLRAMSVRARGFHALRLLDVYVRWRANVKWVAVRLRILKGGRVVWRRTQNEYTFVDQASTTIFDWNAPRKVKRGTRLTLEVTASASGLESKRRLVVRAP